jgi:broad specificity phosphatase PhoE
MNTTTRWWWVRHAPVRVNDGRIYGQTDHPCDCTDEPLFRALATQLPTDAVWVTSTLLRTIQTADALRAAGAVGPEPTRETAFVEQSFGDWQGLKYAELQEKRGESWHRFWLAPAQEAPPGGESFVDLMDRVAPAIDRLTMEHRGIVAVTQRYYPPPSPTLQIPPRRRCLLDRERLPDAARACRRPASGWRRVAVVNHMAAQGRRGAWPAARRRAPGFVMLPRVTLILGGARSGGNRHAEPWSRGRGQRLLTSRRPPPATAWPCASATIANAAARSGRRSRTPTGPRDQAHALPGRPILVDA